MVLGQSFDTYKDRTKHFNPETFLIFFFILTFSVVHLFHLFNVYIICFVRCVVLFYCQSDLHVRICIQNTYISRGILV